MSTATAHGKVILAGEHFVVHGTAALALPVLSRSVTVHVERAPGPWDVPAAVEDHLRACLGALGEDPTHLTIHVESTLPIGAGLGGSAALAVALVRALSENRLDDRAVRDRAHTLEQIAHGTPSGIDGAVATYGCPIFMSPIGNPEPLTLSETPRLWIGVTAEASATREAVHGVRDLAESDPAAFEAVRVRGAELVARAHGALLAADWPGLGAVMTKNHGLLEEIGVSTPGLDALVEAALGAGAFGAKLTGAGCGGSVLAIAPPEVDLESIWRAAGATQVIVP
jgi:mevalonate kinase